MTSAKELCVPYSICVNSLYKGMILQIYKNNELQIRINYVGNQMCSPIDDKLVNVLTDSILTYHI